MNFIKRIFQPGLLIFSLSLLFYTFYKSEIFWGGTKHDYYLNLYLIDGILIFLSLILFLLKDNLKIYFTIFFCSCFISVYIFEAYLILRVDNLDDLKAKSKLYKDLTGKEFDKRSHFEVFRDMKKKDTNVTMTVPFNFFLKKDDDRLFALSGISNSKTIYCNQNGYYSIYQSDRFGFNNPDNEWDKKEIEYFLIGDSFTHGACVNRPDDIASVLRLLSNKSVLNLGYAAKGPLSEYATLREYIRPNIKKIVWFYFEGNDVFNLEQELKSNTLKKYLNDKNFSQELVKKQDKIDLFAKEIIKQEEKKEKSNDRDKVKKIKDFIKIFNTRYIFARQLDPQPQFTTILSHVKDIAQKNNSKFYLVYLPNYSRYKFGYKKGSIKEIKKITDKLDIKFIDIDKEVFKKERDPLQLFPFKINGHYNVLGYKKVTEAVFKLTIND